MSLLLQHPLSAVFPAMSADEFKSLTDSILEVGVLNPITLFEGMVLDGWNRYVAANEVGMFCPTVDLGDTDPKDFVIAQNKARRHITQGQLAMVANAVYQWRSAGRPVGNSAGPAELRQPEIASKSGVSVRSLRQADSIERTAAPEVTAAVKRGEIGLEKASAIAKMPQAEQAAAIHKPLPKPAPVVEPEPEAPPDYTELDATKDALSVISEENDRLNDRLAIAAFEATDEERSAAHDTLIALRAENKTLTATLRAVTLSRDSLMQERAQMLRQLKAQRSEIDRLKSGK